MGNQQSLPDGPPALQTHNPTSSSPIRARQHSNATTTNRAYYGGGAPTSPSASIVDPALLAEYQRLRKEILDDPAFSNDALLPFEDEPPPEASSANLPTSSTPWSKPHASDIVNKPKGYREPDTSGYYDDSGTTFNDIVDTRKLPPPGPPSPPISASYSTRPRQAAAIGTSGASGYQVTGEARARSRAATDASVGSGAVGQARVAASPPTLPPGMPVRVNQNGDAVVDLVLEDGTPLQLRQAKRQFDRDKFKRANNQQATGDTPSALCS
ncbi:hypothetical protein BCR44DRAFT_1496867 [Catenaria anguillulae PL171]|uniref:Uncharacterized protein n=1 Tax=Catenaria anguillulae PL171 TaxID=765915 RepID=A0A1Y2HW72_9FUNG|nr:hypothetical protein BCR44DRAFT_1496867 [Catenaria anguillulae PL171]